MNIKKFTFPTFEEWCDNHRKYEKILGAYKVEIDTFCWNKDSTTYMFALALKNTIPSNVYVNKFFKSSFEYKKEMSVSDLQNWYEITIDEFNSWWDEHIYKNYLEIE